jgi:PAS domain S-box-containing protein
MTAALIAVAVLALVVAGLVARAAARARADAVASGAAAVRYRALLTSLPDVTILEFDRDGVWTLVEGDALGVHGWNTKVLEGRRPSDVVGPERGALLESHHAAALRGEASSLDWPATRGAAVYRLDIAPVRDAAGVIVGGVCVVRDVSVRENLRAELDVHREFFGAALERAAGPVIVCDATGRMVLVNAAARELHGIESDTGEDPSPLDWAERLRVHTPDGRLLPVEEHPLFLAMHGQDVRDVAVAIDSPTRGRRRALISASPIVAADGARLGAVGVAVDVTTERASEAALRASEQHYRSVVQGVDDTVFQTDMKGRWIFLNEAFERATGHRADAMLGRPVSELVHPDDRVAHAQAFQPLMEGRVEAVRHRHRVITADGTVRWAEARARLVPNVGFSGVIEDVTERQRAEEYDILRQAVADRIVRGGELDGLLVDLLETICRGLDWDAAELWTPDDDRLRATHASKTSTLDLLPVDLACEVGEGLPGRAWALRRPVWVPELETEVGCDRALAAAMDGASSALLLPVVSGRRVHAVIVLFSRRRREAELASSRPLDAIASKIALHLEHHDAERLIARQALAIAELRSRLVDLTGS